MRKIYNAGIDKENFQSDFTRTNARKMMMRQSESFITRNSMVNNYI